MLEWLKRLVARRELEELDRWRVECVEARRWFAEFPEVAHALDYLAGFAKGVHGGRIDQARERMRNIRAFREPMRVPPERAELEWMHNFAAEWRAASHEPRGRCIARFDHAIDFSRGPELPSDADGQRERGVDYRFLGMTGEEDS